MLARLIPCLLAVTAAAAPAAERLALDAPGQSVRLEADGAVVVYGGQGFVARWEDRLLTGRAVRWHQGEDRLFATGDIVFVDGKVRIHAARIGLRPEARTGEAWQVQSWIDGEDGRTVRVRAERIELTRTRLTFHDAEVDSGHGGVFSFGCPTIHVYLREVPDKTKEGFRQQVTGIATVMPTAKLARVPVLWLPYLYRDFQYPWPWTRVDAGSSKRLGVWARYWIGTNLGKTLGWRTRVEGRIDRHMRTGNGWGMNAWWRRNERNRGFLRWYEMARERTPDQEDEKDGNQRRRARVVDLEHRFGAGDADGALNLYARWILLPLADPDRRLADGGDRAPGERFRTDYLKEDVDRRPFARRGFTAVYATAAGSLTVDTERRPHHDIRSAERQLGVQLQVPRMHLAGPLGVQGSAWSEALDRWSDDSRALRTTFDGALTWSQWISGWGFDGVAGTRGIQYDRGRLAGIDQDATQERHIFYGEPLLKLRIDGSFLDGSLHHSVTPRIGAQVLGRGIGDILPAYAWGDPRERLDEDQRFWITGVATGVSGTRDLFRADVKARWAMRDLDRRYFDDDGNLQYASWRLADVVGSAGGSPYTGVDLDANFTWDGRIRRWTAFDAAARWICHRRLILRGQSTLQPRTKDRRRQWATKPGATIDGDRYRLDAQVELRPEGDLPIDGYESRLVRRMVDGELSLNYAYIHSDDGGLYEQRFGIGFTLSPTDDTRDELGDDDPRGPAAAWSLR